MQRVEAVVVGDDDVSGVLEEECEHVVALLADGVVQRRVALAVLQTRVAAQLQQLLHDAEVALVDADVKWRLSALVAHVQSSRRPSLT